MALILLNIFLLLHKQDKPFVLVTDVVMQVEEIVNKTAANSSVYDILDSLKIDVNSVPPVEIKQTFDNEIFGSFKFEGLYYKIATKVIFKHEKCKKWTYKRKIGSN